MLRALPGTLSIVLTHLILAIAFVGLGLSLRRLFGLRAITLDDVFTAFWTGFAAVILFLLLWNFLLPVGPPALAIVLAAGAIGIARSRRELAQVFHDGAWRPGPMAWVAVVMLWVANNSLGTVTNWDTQLYHAQGELWARTYHAVPGIANLMGPYAFNNSVLLYDAMVDVGPWAHRPWHVANGLFIVMLAVQSVVCGIRFLAPASPPERRVADLFRSLLLAVPLTAMMGDRASSLITDQATTMVILSLLARWYAGLMMPAREAAEDAWDLFAVVLLAAVAVALKMNSAVFAVFTVGTAAALWLAKRPARPLMRKTLAWCAVAGVAFGLAWTGRGVVLSGYPLFPSSVMAMPVPWRAPAEHAQAEFAYIEFSSRASVNDAEVVSGRAGRWAWLPTWLKRSADNPYNIWIPLGIAVAAAAVVAMRRSRAESVTTRRGRWLLLPICVALTSWFLVAPEPRYATPLFWALAALVVSQAFAARAAVARPALSRAMLAASLLVGASPLLVNPLMDWYAGGRTGNPLMAVARANIRIPPPGHWLEPTTSAVVAATFTTRSGLQLNIPQRHCFNAPLPCTPNPAPNLRLRIPGRLDGGFVLDGGWEMQHWPQPWRAAFLPAWRSRRPARDSTHAGPRS
jgi:hypothetical protein